MKNTMESVYYNVTVSIFRNIFRMCLVEKITIDDYMEDVVACISSMAEMLVKEEEFEELGVHVPKIMDFFNDRKDLVFDLISNAVTGEAISLILLNRVLPLRYLDMDTEEFLQSENRIAPVMGALYEVTMQVFNCGRSGSKFPDFALLSVSVQEIFRPCASSMDVPMNLLDESGKEVFYDCVILEDYDFTTIRSELATFVTLLVACSTAYFTSEKNGKISREEFNEYVEHIGLSRFESISPVFENQLKEFIEC